MSSPIFDDDDYEEPIGSCENCGTNIYADDFDGLCNHCHWSSQNEQERDGDVWLGIGPEDV